MLETLKHIDQEIFFAVNNGMQNSFFDTICPIIRDQRTWYLLYVVIIFFFYRAFGKKTIAILIGAIVLILISDQLSANLIKNLVERFRPCSDPEIRNKVHLLVNCGNGFSFVSAHATNHFAIALYVSGFFRSHKWVLPTAIIWASLISFSQVYVGVHYPFDVICGALLGILLGYGIQRLVYTKILKLN